MPSQGKTVKYRKMSHITSTIRRFGHIKHVSSQTYGHEHVPLKKAVQAANMQSSGYASSFQLVRQLQFRELGRAADTVDFKLGVEQKEYR